MMDEKQQKKSMTWMLVGIAWELGYIIALPPVILGFLGSYADKHYQTSPLFLLIGIFLALTLTTIGLVKKLKSIIRKLNEQ